MLEVYINGFDVTNLVVGFSITRSNDLSGGLSTLQGSLTVITRVNEDYKRCYEVVFATLLMTFVINGFVKQTDGTTLINMVQLTEQYFARQPVYSKKQLSEGKGVGITRSALIADILSDFSVPYSISTFGDKQYDLVGDVDSDPISVAASIATPSGWLTYVEPNNSQVRFTSYNSFITKQAVATGNHIVETAGVTPPELDRVVIVGTTKTETSDRFKKQTIVEESKSVFGTVEERTTTTIDPNTGNEESETICMMKLLRPDTHPKDAQLVIKEQSTKTVYSDNKRRITGYIVDTFRNQAAISQETTDSILVKAERIEYSSDFEDETSEIIANTETTYQAHVIGRLQLVVFKPGGLENKKINPPKQLGGDDGILDEEQENEQYISPLVLTKRVRTTYKKIGTNTWRERVTVSERQFVSKTKKTNGAKNETQEVRLLGGMKTTQNSSRMVDSVPLAQTLPTNENNTEDTSTSLTFYGDTVPSICGNKRTERIELAGVVSAGYLQSAGKLQAIPRLNNKVAYSLIVTLSTIKLIAIAFSKLATTTHNLMPVDITLEFKAGDGIQLAGTFITVSNATRDIPEFTVPPPIILGTGYPLQIPSFIDATPEVGGAIAKPLRPTGGAVSIPTIEEDDYYWYVDAMSSTSQPTIDDFVWVIGNTPEPAVSIDAIQSDTTPNYEYTNSDTAYQYDTTSTVQTDVTYTLFMNAYSYVYR